MVLGVLGFVASLTLGSVAFSAGPKAGGADPNAQGCTCHSPAASTATAITFTGLPTDKYEAGKSYDLTISSTTDVVPADPPQNHGGFHLQASGGTFAARGTTQAGWVNVGSSPVYIEHSKSGETANEPVSGVQTWQVKWTAPTRDDVNFKLWVNRVNGDGAPGITDHWNTQSVTVKAPTTTTTKGGSPGFELAILIVAAAGLLAFALRQR
jgi:hypothetical protein